MVYKKSVAVGATLLAILLLLVGLYVLVSKGRREFFGTPTKVTFYFMPGCPWCEKFEPEWEKFVGDAKKAGLETAKVDGSDPKNRAEVEKKGIKGFPTIIVTKDGKDAEYDGERTAKNLLAFALKA